MTDEQKAFEAAWAVNEKSTSTELVNPKMAGLKMWQDAIDFAKADLIDMFAAAALAGVIPTIQGHNRHISDEDLAAEIAYQYAIAMMKRRAEL